MPTDNRNRFLDAGDSDDDLGRPDDSDDDLQKGGRNAKRRRVDDDESDPEDPSDGEQDQSDADLSDHDGGAALDKDADPADGDVGDKTDGTKAPKTKSSGKPDLPGVTKNLVKPNLVVSDAAIKKSGVVYLSRVPPYMNPHKLRSLLEPYGKINRIFLAPEDPAARTRRIKSGGNKKRFFTEGWVEFLRKKDAKKACELLNAQTIGGKKGSYYRDDIWNLLYLSGFKWHNLTEQISAENAERSSRMRAEITKSTKENKEFAANIERAKVLDGMQEKRRQKGTEAGESDKPASSVSEPAGGSAGGRKRFAFAQVPLAKKRKQGEDQQNTTIQSFGGLF
ncbi:6a7eaee1-a19e-4bb7-86ac-c64a5b42be5c [Podospora conica]|nr:6a7eaee1-a19e-4bb7-86ac-c64a5b42be5c [Schizothecium conicum]